MSSYQSRHRRPRWHDPLLDAVSRLLNAVGRAVAWLLDRIAARLAGDAWEDEPSGGEDVPRPAASTGPFNADAEPGPGHPRVIHAVPIGDGDDFEPLTGRREPWPVNPWAPCAFREDVPRPVDAPTATGPGYPDAWPSGAQREGRALHGLNHAPGMPRPGAEYERPALDKDVTSAGPGRLSMWDITPRRDPGFWAPRMDDTVIEAAPRNCAGRITAVAGART